MRSLAIHLSLALVCFFGMVLSSYAQSFLEARIQGADRGNPEDQAYVGMVYLNGKNQPKNPELAFHYLEQAAHSGHADAQNTLGWMLANGRGTAKDPHRAIFWYEKAAQAMHGGAMNNMAMLYLEGPAMIQDESKARIWLENSAKARNPAGMTNLARFLLKKDPVNAAVRIQGLLEEAAERTHPEASLQLGILYMEGKVLELDDQKALRWLYAAALDKLPEAMERIGWIYEHTSSIKQDVNQAMVWYQRASDLGQVSSLTRIGELYSKGRGVARDPKKAIEYFEQAAKGNNPEAQRKLGLMYYHGDTMNMDATRAHDWFMLAGAAEDPIAQHYLGMMFESGRGCRKNLTEAMRWYTRAIKNGWWQSRAKLDRLKKDLTHPLEVLSPLQEREWKGMELPAKEKVAESRFTESNLDPSRALLPVSHLVSSPQDTIAKNPVFEEHRGWQGLDFRVTQCFFRKSSGLFQWNIEFFNRLESRVNFHYGLAHPQQKDVDPTEVEIASGKNLHAQSLNLLPCGTNAYLWIGRVYYEWRGKLYPLDQKL